VKVILGLGNPGPEYALTRHNVGWWVVDHLAEAWGWTGWKRDGGALVASGLVGSTRVRLVKPQTYVNLSGGVLRPYLRRAQWSAATDLLVVADEVALPVGSFRLRASGSSGGHNGLKSIEAAVGSREYPRLRVGIRPVEPHRAIGALADFVLDATSKAERASILALMPALRDAAECFVRDGITAAMNAFNRRGSPC
jgi:peptidyl-tRNA hydrolase, PTH1 family